MDKHLTAAIPDAYAPAMDEHTLYTDETDRELMERISARDEAALSTLYHRHKGVALRVAMRVIHDHGRAEDVLQEAFLSAWRKSASYVPGRGSVKSWLMGIVRNRAIDVARTLRDPNVDDEAFLLSVRDGSPSVADTVTTRLDAELVRNAILRLPEAQRHAVTAAFLHGRSHADIARAFETPLGTIHGRVRLGLRRLQKVLIADGVAASATPAESAGFAAIMRPSPPSPQNRAA